MKNQNLKAIMIVVVLMFTASMAEAQIVERYRAQVPFDFSVGKMDFTAGEYFVEVRGFESRTILIRNPTTRRTYAAIMMPSGETGSDRTASLKFLQNGTRFALSSVSIASQAAHFPTPSAEPLLAEKRTGNNLTIALGKGKDK